MKGKNVLSSIIVAALASVSTYFATTALQKPIERPSEGVPPVVSDYDGLEALKLSQSIPPVASANSTDPNRIADLEDEIDSLRWTKRALDMRSRAANRYRDQKDVLLVQANLDYFLSMSPDVSPLRLKRNLKMSELGMEMRDKRHANDIALIRFGVNRGLYDFRVLNPEWGKATLSEISEKYGVSESEIIRVNNLFIDAVGGKNNGPWLYNENGGGLMMRRILV